MGWFMNVDQEQLRLLPSVDELLHSSSGQQLVQQYSREMALRAVRASIAQARAQIRLGAQCPSSDELVLGAERILKRVNIRVCILSSMPRVSLSILTWDAPR